MVIAVGPKPSQYLKLSTPSKEISMCETPYLDDHRRSLVWINSFSVGRMKRDTKSLGFGLKHVLEDLTVNVVAHNRQL